MAKQDKTPQPPRPSETAVERIERIAQEAEEQRARFYDQCLEDYHDAEGAIALIKSKPPREQRMLEEQLKIEQERSDFALYHITGIESEDILPRVDEQIANINGIADADQTEQEKSLFLQLLEQKTYLEERMKKFGIGQPKKEAQATAAPKEKAPQPARPLEPVVGSQEWKDRIIQAAASAKLRRDEILAERALLLAMEPEFLAHRDIQTRLKTIDKELTEVQTHIPPDRQAAKTVIIEKAPAAQKKEAPKPVYTPEELDQQAIDEDLSDEMAEINRAKKDIKLLDARIAAQDKRTLAGREKIAELEAARKEATDYLAKFEPEPPNIRPEVKERIDKLSIIEWESRDLYNKSLAFMGDKAQAAAAVVQIERLNEHINADYQVILSAIRKELKQLTEIQRQEIPSLPENVDEGSRGLAAWFDEWKDTEAGSGDIAKQKLPFYKRIFAQTNEQALDNLLAIARSPELEDVLKNQAEREVLRLTWEQEVRDQQTYIDTFSKEVMDVIKNGLPELPANITDNERAALIPYLTQIISNTEVTKVPDKVDTRTLKRWNEFDKAARKQLDILQGKIKQEATAIKPEPTTPHKLRRPGEAAQVTVEEYAHPAQPEVLKDPRIYIEWSKPAEQARLMEYRDSCKKGTAAWAAAELLRAKQGFTNKSYFIRRTKGYDEDELEDAWDNLVDAMET
jgi:hypothetical protein